MPFYGNWKLEIENWKRNMDEKKKLIGTNV
jgi:hypothetical protein